MMESLNDWNFGNLTQFGQPLSVPNTHAGIVKLTDFMEISLVVMQAKLRIFDPG